MQKLQSQRSQKEDLAGIVGFDSYFEEPSILESYSKDLSFVAPRRPSAVVKPKNADEVQRIVKWANRTLTPLIPVSSGSPHFRGDTIPTRDGTVVVDLSDMKRILKIDRRNRFAIFEPGVTWGMLQSELAKEGMRIPMPLLPRATKSVIGSLLEREPILAPRYAWTLIGPLRCLEVIWGTGDKLLTGEAGLYLGSMEEQWKMGAAYVNPMGPLQVDYHRIVSAAQGTMGIVTWASGRCEILPQEEELFFAPSESFSSLVDFTYRFVRFRYGDELLFLNGWNLASMLGKSPSEITELAKKLPSWILILTVSGYDMLPKERIKVEEKDTKDLAKSFNVQLLQSIPGAESKQVLEILGKTSGEPYWKLKYKGGCQDIFFLTTLDKVDEFVKTISSVAESVRYPTSEIGVYVQPEQQGVACHCEFDLFYNPDDPKEVDRVKEMLAKGSEELIAKGAFFSRPYGIWADMAYKRDVQNTNALKKIKGIFDPNNVLNPGRLCFKK